MTGMMLHCGGKEVALQDVLSVATPEATRTHVPIPHAWFLDEVRGALELANIEAYDWNYALNHQGQQLFAVARVRGDLAEGRDEGVIGLRNAHDKAYKASLAYGRRVFVCDNLGFGGEVTVGRKHTPGILDDLPDLLMQAAHHLTGMRDLFAGRYDEYQQCEVVPDVADLLFCELIRRGIAPDLNFVKRAMYQWESPSHEEFEPRTMWAWFNACTEAFKSCGLPNPGRTMRLHQLADQQAGYVIDGEVTEVVVQ